MLKKSALRVLFLVLSFQLLGPAQAVQIGPIELMNPTDPDRTNEENGNTYLMGVSLKITPEGSQILRLPVGLYRFGDDDGFLTLGVTLRLIQDQFTKDNLQYSDQIKDWPVWGKLITSMIRFMLSKIPNYAEFRGADGIESLSSLEKTLRQLSEEKTFEQYTYDLLFSSLGLWVDLSHRHFVYDLITVKLDDNISCRLTHKTLPYSFSDLGLADYPFQGTHELTAFPTKVRYGITERNYGVLLRKIGAESEGLEREINRLLLKQEPYGGLLPRTLADSASLPPSPGDSPSPTRLKYNTPVTGGSTPPSLSHSGSVSSLKSSSDSISSIGGDGSSERSDPDPTWSSDEEEKPRNHGKHRGHHHRHHKSRHKDHNHEGTRPTPAPSPGPSIETGQVSFDAALGQMSTFTNTMMQQAMKKGENVVLCGKDILQALRIIALFPNSDPFMENLRSLGVNLSMEDFIKLDQLLSAEVSVNFFKGLVTTSGEEMPFIKKSGAEVWRMQGKSTSEVVKAINAKVSDKTGKMIQEIVTASDFNDRTKFAYFSTAYLNCLWKSPFDRERSGTFTNAKKKEHDIKYLLGSYMDIRFNRLEDGTSVIAIPLKSKKPGYQSGATAYYVVLLPKDIKSPARFFTPDCMKDLRKCDSELLLPKMSINSETDVKELLRSCGFKAIDSTFWEDSLVGVLRQTAVMETTLKGVKAAAATVAVGERGSSGKEPKIIMVDRPHTVAIVANTNGNWFPLFTAYVSDLRGE